MPLKGESDPVRPQWDILTMKRQAAARQECLSFFRTVVDALDAIQRWRRWWLDHQGLVEVAFEPGDYELLRTGRLDAAAMMLKRQDFEKAFTCRFTTVFSSSALSETRLQAIEQQHRIRLPADYRHFLLSFNGAHVQPGWFQCDRAERLILQLLPAEGGLAADHPWNAAHRQQALWPIAILNSRGGMAASNELLLLDHETIRFWRSDHESLGNEQLVRVAGSFRELLCVLDYPEGGRPWMGLIDNGDLEGFTLWLHTNPDLDKRDPASGFLPFEYLAISRDINAYAGQPWADEEGQRRAVGRGSISQMMIERGASPGRGFYHAVAVRKFALAERLLPLSPQLARQDLLDARSVLRSAPGQEALLRAVERELRRQKVRRPARSLNGLPET
jgi:hypothetical protein